MSKTIDFAFATGTAVARVIASGYTPGSMLWLPVEKPPDFAHAAAASGVARNVSNALIAGLSRNVTIRSPPISRALEPAALPSVGKLKTLKPVLAFAFVDDRITLPTKSPSKTIAAFAGFENAFVTESLKFVWIAPDVPPAMFDVSPSTWPMVFRALITDGSVHLILWALRALYLSGPNVRR